MPDIITGASAEMDVTKATLISSMVQKELAFKAKLIPFITDVSSMALPGMKTINFPKLASFSVANRAEGVSGNAQTSVATADSLNLNFNAYCSWVIDAYTLAQANISVQLEYAKLAAAAQARYVDNQIVSTLASVAASFVNVGADVDVTYVNLVNMLKAIELADGDTSQCTWIISPTQKAALFNITEIKNWNQFGQAVMPNGVIGSILGCPVVVHNGLATKQAFLVEKSAVAIGFQKNAAYGEQDAIDYGVGAKKAAIDQLFGIAGMQLALRGAAAGKSPLVVGLND